MIDEIWDWITEKISYIFSFEWFSDLGEFFGAMFSGLTELSIYGLFFGAIGFGTIFFLRNYMLVPFTSKMTPFSAIFWTIATYISTFIAGYLVGKGFENTA